MEEMNFIIVGPAHQGPQYWTGLNWTSILANARRYKSQNDAVAMAKALVGAKANVIPIPEIQEK